MALQKLTGKQVKEVWFYAFAKNEGFQIGQRGDTALKKQIKREDCFGRYIAELRKEQGISMAQLCDGLCDVGILSRFERGERMPEKLLQDRFLTRLGVAPENHECFLYYKDYVRWQKRQEILHAVIEEKIEDAKLLLEAYRQDYFMEHPLEYQFYLAMLGQVKCYEGCAGEELRELFRKALSLIVTGNMGGNFAEKVLSIEEINLYLEYIRYCGGNSIRIYNKLIHYIEQTQKTPLSMAKLYPKAVYYYYLEWKKEKNGKDVAVLLNLCENGIEVLRTVGRSFFLLELIGMKEELLQFMVEEDSKRKELFWECENWRNALYGLYGEYGISKETKEYSYIYLGAEAYCIGDVVHTRRQMVGWNRAKLCEGICSEQTLRHLERNEKEPQREVIRLLLDRLHLPYELYRTELITSNHANREKYKQLKSYIDNQQQEQADEIYEELIQNVDMENPLNRQALEPYRIIRDRRNKVCENKEYIQRMKKILEYTIPYSAVLDTEEVYLTHTELTILRNMMPWMEPMERKKCTEAMCRTEEESNYRDHLHVMEYLICWVASELGNAGDYVKSNVLSEMQMITALRYRRLNVLHDALYNITWNRQQGLHNPEEIKVDLKKCVILSGLCRESRRQKIYQKKIEDTRY